MQNILEQLAVMLREFLGDNTITIAPEMPLRGALGLDSYDMASLLGEVEERFDVEIPDRAVMEMITVGDVVDYLTAHAGK